MADCVRHANTSTCTVLPAIRAVCVMLATLEDRCVRPGHHTSAPSCQTGAPMQSRVSYV